MVEQSHGVAKEAKVQTLNCGQCGQKLSEPLKWSKRSKFSNLVYLVAGEQSGILFGVVLLQFIFQDEVIQLLIEKAVKIKFSAVLQAIFRCQLHVRLNTISCD